jgi:hypothetical protein
MDYLPVPMTLMLHKSLEFMKPAVEGKKLGLDYLQALSIFQQVREEARKRGIIDGALPGCRMVTLTRKNELMAILDDNAIIIIPRPLGDQPLPARLAIMVGKMYDQLETLVKVGSKDEVIAKFFNDTLTPIVVEAKKEKEKE